MIEGLQRSLQVLLAHKIVEVFGAAFNARVPVQGISSAHQKRYAGFAEHLMRVPVKLARFDINRRIPYPTMALAVERCRLCGG
jgi:hypothetical protein